MAVEKAFLDVYDRYGAQILRHIEFRVSDKRVAQEIFQESFLRAWRHVAEKGDAGNLRALVYAIAKNLIIDHYRWKGRSDLPLENLGAREPMSDDLEEKVALAGEIERAKEAIEKLDSDDEKAIVYLRYVDDLSVGEIAELLDKTPGNVRVIIHRSIAKLKKIL